MGYGVFVILLPQKESRTPLDWNHLGDLLSGYLSEPVRERLELRVLPLRQTSAVSAKSIVPVPRYPDQKRSGGAPPGTPVILHAMKYPPKRILLVQDDLIFLERLASSLRRWGHEVMRPSGLEGTIAMLSRFSPEGAVIDLRLEEESGLVVDQIETALLADLLTPVESELESPVPSLDRVEWEHLQRVLRDCGGNINATARKLGLECRSLQRKLSKHPPEY